ncbi:MAG TPA: PTS sugar transporter subunit IIB [Gemmatimonadales bacterium]|jgi:PTS system mannose-specific IIB component/fructoselysine and glucoselysine-specific PTS system IIB component
MPLRLFRVDDRLVHGQVVLGWGRPLAARFIVLVDDAVRQSAWEQDLYRMAVPDDVSIIFASAAEAVSHLAEWNADPRPGMLLTADLATMAVLHDAAPGVVREINLGGLHHRPGRAERLRYVYLAAPDEALLRRLAHDGARIVAQDLPTAAAIDLETLLR